MLLKKPETPQFFSDSLLNWSNSKQQTGEKIKGKTTSCVVLYGVGPAFASRSAPVCHVIYSMSLWKTIGLCAQVL